MKIKIVSKVIESALGTFVNEDEPRADMYLSTKALAMSIAALLAGIGAIVYYFLVGGIYAMVMGPVLLVVGIGLFLCWKNQTITIIDEETFEYKTFLGNKKVIAFADITDLRKNQDSLTLYAGTTKIQIESMTIMTTRLKDKINEALAAR